MTQISVSGADNTALNTPSSAIMLAKYQYESGVNNGRLQKMTFGNDQTVQYSYDKFDRTTKEQYNNVTYEYAYDASGQLAKQTSTAGEEYNYEYDILAGTITGAVNGGICGLIVDSGVFTGGISLLLCGVTGVLCEASNQAANGKTIKDMDYVSIGLSGLFSAISCGWSNSIEKVMKEASKTATNAVATIRGVGISLVGIGTSKTHNDIKSKKNKKISDDQMRRWERMTEYYRHQVIK